MQNLIRNQQGNVIIIFSLVIGILAMITLTAIGFSQYNIAKTSVQNALDNALLSGIALSITNQQDVTSSVQQFMSANLSNKSGATVNKITVTQTSQNPPQWTGTASVTINYFSGLEKIANTFTLTSVVQWVASSNQATEVVFTINTSTSMCLTETDSQNFSGTWVASYAPDANCTKLSWMKKAITQVITNGLAPIQNAGGPAFKVGIIPYNHKILLPPVNAALNPTASNCPTPTAANPTPDDSNCFVSPANAKGLNIPAPLASIEASNPQGWSNNEGKTAGTTYYTDFTDAWPLAPVWPLSSISKAADQTSLVNYINGITQQTTGLGWVRSDTPALTAALMLDPAYNAAFGGLTPAAFGSGGQKIVVLMTDGANVGCCFSDYPDTAAQAAAMKNYNGPVPNWSDQYLYAYAADDAALTGGSSNTELTNFNNTDQLNAKDTAVNYYGVPSLGICEQLKAQGVIIYAVLLDVGVDNPGASNIRNAYQSCATDSQHFFDIQMGNESSLQNAYQSLAKSFVALRVVQ